MSPHEVNYRAAVARALQTEKDIERSEEQAHEHAQRAMRTASIVGIAALFCASYLILLYGQIAAVHWANVFLTLAINLDLWIVGALSARIMRRPR